MKIKAGDQVVVIAGKDKGKTGNILRVLSTGRVVVAGINMRTKHVKATPQRPGQRVQYEASIDASNVMFVDPKSKKRSRLGYKEDKGKKVRVAKASGEVVTGVAAVAKKADDAKPKKATDTAAKKTTSKKKETSDIEKVDGPDKKTFWNKIGFGASEMEDADVDAKAVSKKDHSVPEQGQTPDTKTHQRGN